MLDKKKYRLLTTANKVTVITVYDRLNEALSYQDEFIDFCCLHLLDFQVLCTESVVFSRDELAVLKKLKHLHVVDYGI